MMNSRLVRIFISSTFRDFRLERDELVKKVFPELRRRCKNRFVEVVEVDLRWGVTDEQSLKGETLRICLAEIDKCRPSNPVFFIGLLGERYGWIPPHDYYPKDLLENEKTNWVKSHIGGKSVTELEILHGVLNNPKMAEYAFFYFRSSDYVEKYWDEIVKAYPDSKKEDFRNQGDDDHSQIALDKRQEDLKNRIRSTAFQKNSVRDVANHHELADKILEDLWRKIDSTYPVSEVPDEWERQKFEHEAFALSRTKGYVPRSCMFEALDAILIDTQRPCRVVTGESGGGKSALLAAWLERLRSSGALPSRTFFHFIGGTPESSTAQNIVNRLVNALKAWGTVEENIPEDYREVLIKLPVYLENAGKLDNGILIVLDALNQLESQKDQELYWLPETLPAGVHLVVSTLPGRCEEVLKQRGWLQQQTNLEVGPLDMAERRKIISTYLGIYTKSLPPHLVDRLAESKQCANALFLMVLLNEMRIRGQHESLGPMLENYLSCPGLIELFVKVIKSLEEFNDSRERLVGDALGYLAVARRGLTETELLELLSNSNKPSEMPLPRAQWSPLYLALEESLISRNGRLSFFHDYLRQAVMQEYLDKESERVAIHQRLAEVALAWNSDRFSPSLRIYGLEYGAGHLAGMNDHDKLWKLLKDEDYRKEQIITFKQYHASFRAMQEGISFFISRDGLLPEDDARLCWLALRAGELGRQSATDIQIAFDWAKNRPLNDSERMTDALKRLEVLNEQEFFKAVLLLLWIEANRHSAEPEDIRSTRDVDLILDAVAQKIPAGIGIVDWDKFLLKDFMVFFVRTLLQVFPIESDIRFLELVGHASDKMISELIVFLLNSYKKDQFNPDQVRRLFLFGLSMAERISDNENKAFVLADVAKGQALAGDINEAKTTITQSLTLADGIEGNQSKAKVLAEITIALAQIGDRERAQSISALALSLAEGIEYPYALINTLDTIAWAHVQIGEIEHAQEICNHLLLIIKDMQNSDKEWGFYLTSMTMSQMKLFPQALSLTEKIEDDNHKIKALTYIAGELKQAGEKEQAQLIYTKLIIQVKKIIEAGYNYESVPALAFALARTRMFPQALALTTFPQGIRSNLYKSVALAGVIWELALIDNELDRVNFLAQAQHLLDKLEVGNDNSNKARSAMVTVLARAGDADLAQSVFAESLLFIYKKVSDPNKPAHLAAIAKEWARLEKKRNAEATFSEAVSLALEVREEQQSDEILEKIVSTLSQAGMFARALVEAEKINTDSNKSKALVAFVSALAQTEEIFNCADLFSKALSLLESIKDASSKCRFMTAFVSALAQSKDFLNRDILFSQAITKAWKFESNSDASQTLIDIYTVLVQKDAIQNRQVLLTQVISLAAKLYDDYWKARTLFGIVEAHIRSRNFSNIRALLTNILSLAKNINQAFYPDVLAAIALALAKSGDIDRSRLICSQTISLLEAVNDDESKTKIRTTIAMALAQAGDKEQAWKYFTLALSLDDKKEVDANKIRSLLNITRNLLEEELQPDCASWFTNHLFDIARNLSQSNSLRKDKLASHGLCLFLIKISQVFAQVGELDRASLEYTLTLDFIEGREEEDRRPALIGDILDNLGRAKNMPNRAALASRAIDLLPVNYLSYCAYDIPLLLLQAVDEETCKILLTRLLLLAAQMKDSMDQYLVLSEIGSSFAQIEHPSPFVEALNQANWPHMVWQKVLPKWREALLNMKSHPLSLFRQSMGYFPFHCETAHNGVFTFIQALYSSNKVDHAQAIIRNCPQLGLGCLLENNEPDRSDDKPEEQIFNNLENQKHLGTPLNHQADILGHQADNLYSQGAFEDALALYKAQERICRESGNHDGLTRSLINQAHLLSHELDQPQEAIPVAEEALDLAERHGLRSLTKEICAILADVKRLGILAALTVDDVGTVFDNHN